MSDRQSFDVVVCGAGLAGLCAARQLRLELPGLSVAVIDPNVAPLPEAAWKVGESTVEFGAHYLAEYLRLDSYLKESQLTKLGLRFFFPSARSMAARPEVGLRTFAEVSTYQLDRGILENDLREMARADGTALFEGCLVRRLEIGEGDRPHVVAYTESADAGEERLIECRWLIDASGRRQLIQRQLKLRRPSAGESCSAAWFRLQGRWDVDDLVPEDDAAWHERVPGRIRYYSTNHLCAEGYWVWLIPLSSHVTSIGIVARDDMHAFDGYNTYERALGWLAKHEPELAQRINGRPPIDFRAIKGYSYTTERVFSPDRWACVGEAGFFADPFYSPGTDLIAIGNTLVCDLIRRDRAGSHDAKRVDQYSVQLVSLNDQLTSTIQHGYNYLGDEIVSLARGLWDYSAAWGHLCPQLFNRTFADDEKQTALRPKGLLPLFAMAGLMRSLLDEWLRQRQARGGHLTYDFVNYLGIAWLAEFRGANLRKFDSVEALGVRYRANLEFFEELMQALFLLAVEDLHPAELSRLDGVTWMNVQRLSLDPTQWKSSGIFEPRSAPRRFRHLYDQVRSQLRAKEESAASGQMSESSKARRAGPGPVQPAPP